MAHLLVSELCRFQNARCNDKNNRHIFIGIKHCESCCILLNPFPPYRNPFKASLHHVCAISAVTVTETSHLGLWKIRISQWHCESMTATHFKGPCCCDGPSNTTS